MSGLFQIFLQNQPCLLNWEKDTIRNQVNSVVSHATFMFWPCFRSNDVQTVHNNLFDVDWHIDQSTNKPTTELFGFMYKIKEKVVIFSRFVHRFKFFIRAYVSYPCTELVDASVQLLPCTPEIQAHQRETKYFISSLEFVLFNFEYSWTLLKRTRLKRNSAFNKH